LKSKSRSRNGAAFLLVGGEAVTLFSPEVFLMNFSVTRAWVLLILALPFGAAAQHFKYAYIDIRLLEPDSVLVEFTADRQDIENAVQTFPDLYTGEPGTFYPLYQQRVEAYLQTRLHLRADGKAVRLAAVRWKPGGKDRNDHLDSVSGEQSYHTITLGGRLPASAALLTVRADVWIERPDKPKVSMVEYAFFEGDRALRRHWIPTERMLRFPLLPDSLAVMRKTPPQPATVRVPVDHSGHGH
jgi:hypothetical protein